MTETKTCPAGSAESASAGETGSAVLTCNCDKGSKTYVPAWHAAEISQCDQQAQNLPFAQEPFSHPPFAYTYFGLIIEDNAMKAL
jgi:hypothetical protein